MIPACPRVGPKMVFCRPAHDFLPTRANIVCFRRSSISVFLGDRIVCGWVGGHFSCCQPWFLGHLLTYILFHRSDFRKHVFFEERFVGSTIYESLALTVYSCLQGIYNMPFLRMLFHSPWTLFPAPGMKKCVLGPPNPCHKIENMFK